MTYQFPDNASRAKFIAEMESSIYMGTNEHGEQTFIFLEQGDGMVVKVIHEDRPNTFECVEYDSDGRQLCQYYETDDTTTPRIPDTKYPKPKKRASDRRNRTNK